MHREMCRELFPALRTIGKYSDILRESVKECVSSTYRYDADPKFMWVDDKEYMHVVSEVETLQYDYDSGKFIPETDLEEGKIHIDQLIEIAINLKRNQERGNYGTIYPQCEHE